MKLKWNFKCFTSCREEEPVKQSLIVRRSKRGKKSVPSKAKNGSDRAEELKMQASVRIVSISHGGEVIPVAFVSPNKGSFDERVSVKSQKTDQFMKTGEKGRVVDQHSWVRIIVKESAISSPKIRTVQKASNTAKDSIPRPQACAIKANAVDLRKPLVEFPVRKVEGFNLAISLSVFMIILASLCWDKFVAIACTCIWWYTVPLIRGMAKIKNPAGIEKDSRNPCKILMQSNLRRRDCIKV